MTWAISPIRRRPGELLTRGDVCHLHADRDEAEQCGAEQGGAPELVKLERRSERVYRVVWSLSDTAGGKLRRPVAGAVQPARGWRRPEAAHEWCRRGFNQRRFP